MLGLADLKWFTKFSNYKVDYQWCIIINMWNSNLQFLLQSKFTLLASSFMIFSLMIFVCCHFLSVFTKKTAYCKAITTTKIVYHFCRNSWKIYRVLQNLVGLTSYLFFAKKGEWFSITKNSAIKIWVSQNWIFRQIVPMYLNSYLK